jgi:hypothetical protein
MRDYDKRHTVPLSQGPEPTDALQLPYSLYNRLSIIHHKNSYKVFVRYEHVVFSCLGQSLGYILRNYISWAYP